MLTPKRPKGADENENSLVVQAIRHLGVSAVANALGVDRKRVYRWMRNPALLTDDYVYTVKLAQMWLVSPDRLADDSRRRIENAQAKSGREQQRERPGK